MATSNRLSADQLSALKAKQTAGAVLGIDLGTTTTLVAAIDKHSGMPKILTNADGDMATPSCVLVESAEKILVGKPALRAAKAKPINFIELAKRSMGQSSVFFAIGEVALTPTDVAAKLLKTVTEAALKRLGASSLFGVVVTVPEWFDADAKAATRAAAERAGVPLLALVSEPLAAILAHGMHDKTDETVVVYDLGGGTFDVVVVKLGADGVVKMLGHGGDVKLGGRDWDQVLIDDAAKRFFNEYGVEIPGDSPDYFQLALDAQETKIRLTNETEADLWVEYDKKKLRLVYTREQFDELTLPLLARTRGTTDLVLTQAKLSPEKIDRCVPVGGATKMPQVHALLDGLFPGKVDHTAEKDHVVAFGACVYAVMMALDNKVPDPLPGKAVAEQAKKPDVPSGPTRDEARNTAVDTIAERTYGMRVKDAASEEWINDILVNSGEHLPKKFQRPYVTSVADEFEVELQLLQGEARLANDCRPLKKRQCRMDNRLPKGYPIHCRIEITAECEIRVWATIRDPMTGEPREFPLEYTESLGN